MSSPQMALLWTYLTALKGTRTIFAELYLEKSFTTDSACYIVDHRCNSSGFNFMCITAMINYVFISFSTVQIYNISYIHLQTLHLLLFYLQKWVCICVLWHAGVHQTIFRSRCRDDVVSRLTRSRGWSYTGQTSIIRTWSQGLICVQKIRRHLDIVFHAAKLFATTQVLVTETRTHHEITFLYRWCNVFLVSTLVWSLMT